MTTEYNTMFSTLNHNIILMLSQINGNLEYSSKEDNRELKRELRFIQNKIKKILEEAKK